MCKSCKSVKLAIDILAQVEQDGLLVIRSEPSTGDLVGRAGPLSVVNIVDGPTCASGAVWLKVNITALNLSGWATENSLYACSKDECKIRIRLGGCHLQGDQDSLLIYTLFVKPLFDFLGKFVLFIIRHLSKQVFPIPNKNFIWSWWK